MKRCYWADLLRTIADKDDNIKGLWEKNMMVLDAIYRVSWA
jgi:hypothetical protein